MSIKRDTIKYVAGLARINLTPEQQELFASQLNDILSYGDKLNKLDTKSVEPMSSSISLGTHPEQGRRMSHAVSMGNVLREDKVRASLDTASKARQMMSKWYFLFLGIILACNLTARELHAELVRANPDKVRLIGRLYAGSPREYAIIKDLKDGKRKVYGLGDVVNNEFVVFSVQEENIILQTNSGEKSLVWFKLGSPANGLEYMGRILADTFEYYYQLCDSRNNNENFDSEFEISAIRSNKILLQRDYIEEDSYLRNEYVAADKLEGLSEVVRLDEKVFSQLKTSQISENEYRIEAKGTNEAMENIEKVVASVKGIRPNFNLWQAPSITFNTELGEAKLDKNGLLVDSLGASGFIERVGLKKGDIIKKVNGEQVNNLIGLYMLFRKIKHDSLPRVTIEIERDNKPIALTYKIKT